MTASINSIKQKPLLIDPNNVAAVWQNEHNLIAHKMTFGSLTEESPNTYDLVNFADRTNNEELHARNLDLAAKVVTVNNEMWQPAVDLWQHEGLNKKTYTRAKLCRIAGVATPRWNKRRSCDLRVCPNCEYRRIVAIAKNLAWIDTAIRVELAVYKTNIVNVDTFDDDKAQVKKVLLATKKKFTAAYRSQSDRCLVGCRVYVENFQIIHEFIAAGIKLSHRRSDFQATRFSLPGDQVLSKFGLSKSFYESPLRYVNVLLQVLPMLRLTTVANSNK
jgi:hypothetical protein